MWRHTVVPNGLGFVFGSRLADCDWLRNLFKKDSFSILFDKAICAITAKQQNCQFLVPKGNVQNKAARFALKTFVTALTNLFPSVDTNTLLSWTVPFRTKDTSNNVLISLCLFKESKKNPLVIPQKNERLCLIFKRNIAQMTSGRPLEAFIVASAARLKCFFFCLQILSEHIVFGWYTFSISWNCYGRSHNQ